MADPVRVARYPIRLIRGRWPTWLESRASRSFRDDPTVVLQPSVSGEMFRQAMDSFSMGGTIKITRRDRHPEVDALLVEHVDLEQARILDIGASDGSASLDLLGRLPDSFASYTIADLHLYADVRRSKRHTVFFETDGTPFLVVGRRVLAWPGGSRTTRLVFAAAISAARRAEGDRLLLVNPAVRVLAENDPRVRFAVHDVFTPWAGPSVDVIKVANLLRHDYFSEDRLVDGFAAILASLRHGGHLLVANNLRTGTGPVGALFRKEEDRFRTIDAVGGSLDVEPQVLAAR